MISTIVRCLLKEVQMPPGVLLPVVRLGRPTALRTGEQRARPGGDGEAQLMRPPVGLQPLVDHPPRRRQPGPESEDVALAHAAVSLVRCRDKKDACRWADPKAWLSGRSTACRSAVR